MNFAYIISAYKLPDLLIRLVNRLQSENATFFIHVDKKSASTDFKQMQAGLKVFSNVYFLERHTCHWGDFGHVRATLKGIQELVTRDITFDYALLLTGQDYPLKTKGAIENFFYKMRASLSLRIPRFQMKTGMLWIVLSASITAF